MKFSYELNYLSEAFYQSYPNSVFEEIEYKLSRVYVCLSIDTGRGYSVCIPYRSHITHPYAYLFKQSVRSKRTKSGLDYTKIAIISNGLYFDSSKTAIVDKDEYSETIENINVIMSEALSYVDNYINHISNICTLHEKEFARRYKYSTLKYFHDILKL